LDESCREGEKEGYQVDKRLEKKGNRPWRILTEGDVGRVLGGTLKRSNKKGRDVWTNRDGRFTAKIEVRGLREKKKTGRKGGKI